MPADLKDKRIAILATDGVEGVELTSPREALELAGATVEILALDDGTIRLWDHDEKRGMAAVDAPVAEADAAAYDGLVLPGGVRSADRLRVDEGAVRFVSEVDRREVPIGVICHGSWILIEAGVVSGRTMTSHPALRTDLRNAGAQWIDEEVVIDRGLVSSRRPADLPAFNARLVEAFAGGTRERHAA